MNYKRPTPAQGAAKLADHYQSEINQFVNQIGFEHDMGLPATEERLSQRNELLYQLFVKRDTMLGILHKLESEDTL